VAPALSSPTKPNEPSMSPSTNHLKPTGTSYSLRPSFAVTAIDHLTADHGLADRDFLAPVRAVLEQIVRRHRQVVIRGQQARAARHDTVPVVIGVAGECDIERSFSPMSRCIA
jgi:hypothetical protein